MKQIIICFAFFVISSPDFQAQTKNQRDNTFEIFQTSDDDGEIEKINLGQNLVIARLNESKDYFYVLNSLNDILNILYSKPNDNALLYNISLEKFILIEDGEINPTNQSFFVVADRIKRTVTLKEPN